MRILTVLIGCAMLAALGCAGTFNSQPPQPVPAGPATEFVPLKLAFDDTFADTEGAKRVVLCQLRDERTTGNIVGEGPVSGDRSAVTKYVMKDDPTLTLPRILGKEIKAMGLNVTTAERLNDPVGGVPVREILKRTGGDYLVAGRIEELTVRGRSGEGRPVFVTVSLRLDIYNKAGELRMYYPVHCNNSEFLGDKAGDSSEVNALVESTVNEAITNAVEDPYFIKAFDLDPDAVKKLREAAKANCPPVKPDETNSSETPAATTPTETPAEVKPDATKPAEEAPAPPLTDAERKAKELDDAVKGEQK